MALTPMDIYNKEFKKGFRGYDEEEVDMFLDQVVDEYEKLQKANAEHTEKIQSLTERLEHYKSLEGTLKETLMTAQNTAEEVVENARKRAALIVDSAQREARDIVERANGRIEHAEKMDMEVRKAAAVFKSRFVALLEAQLEFFRQETADIKAEQNRIRSDHENPETEAYREPEAPIAPEPEPAAAYVEAESAAPIKEEPEPQLPLEEREEPLGSIPSQETPLDSLPEQEQSDGPLPEQEEPYPVRAEPSGPEAGQEKLEAGDPQPESIQEQPDEVEYFQQSEPTALAETDPQPEPPDAAEEEIDDADALIREIQHYSALRNDEDTVSDEGFIIGRDD